LVKKAFKQKEFSYGLIFMDCSMPIMNGYDASDAIRQYVKDRNFMQPMIVACTGHTEDEYIKKAWEH
jgi:CheY-like chemotaxis protein